jgi:hypothetical protein
MQNGKLHSEEHPGNPTVSYTSRFQLNERRNGEPLRVLSEDDWAHWKHNGYVIVKNAVPPENIEAAVSLLWEFEEKDPHDRRTWYGPPTSKREIRMKELKNTGMVEAYNHQALWNNRQQPKVHQVFADIWGTEKLWVSIDRANLNLPLHPDWEYKAFIHWDIDTSLQPRPVNVQGVLALNDQTDPNMGGFQCIPELYRRFEEWVKTQPADRDPFMPDITGLPVEKIALEAGDLLIWDSMLAHGIRANHSDRPRLAQYISMTPAQEHNEDLRQWRIASWRDRIIPQGYAFPGDPRNWEQTKYKRAVLTELGEKLLGLKNWQGRLQAK